MSPLLSDRTASPRGGGPLSPFTRSRSFPDGMLRIFSASPNERKAIRRQGRKRGVKHGGGCKRENPPPWTKLLLFVSEGWRSLGLLNSTLPSFRTPPPLPFRVLETPPPSPVQLQRGRLFFETWEKSNITRGTKREEGCRGGLEGSFINFESSETDN